MATEQQDTAGLSPFQECMAVLEEVARRMWKNGVEGKTLHQHEYLWPMADAIDKFECALTGKEYIPPPTNIRPLTDEERRALVEEAQR